MITRSISLALLASLATAPSFAGPSEWHSVQSANHSALASSHGSAAAASVAATVVAAPIIAFGSVVTVSGIALEEVGTGSLALGADLARAGAAQHVTTPVTPRVVQPDGAPTLD